MTPVAMAASQTKERVAVWAAEGSLVASEIVMRPRKCSQGPPLSNRIDMLQFKYDDKEYAGLL
jgi:hypothetical protein